MTRSPIATVEPPARNSAGETAHALPEVASLGTWLFEASPDGLMLLDLHGRVLRVNRSGLRLLGIAQAAAVHGAAWASLWPSESRRAIMLAVASARLAEPTTFQALGPDAAGGTRWWDVTLTPVLKDGKPSCLLSLLRGLPERDGGDVQQGPAELAGEIARTRSRAAAWLDQRVRTPVTGILGAANSMHGASLDASQRASLDKILSFGRQVVSVLDEAADLSRLDSGTLQLNARDFNLAAVLERAASLAEPTCRMHGVSLQVHIARAVRDKLFGDPVRLCQILVSYIQAVAGWAVRGAACALVVDVMSRQHEEVVLSFGATTRCGASAPSASDLFGEAGLRAPERAAQESGPRLALCRRLAQLMGGNAGIERRPDGQAQLWFSARFREAATDGTEVAIFADPPAVLAGKRVLVLDDDKARAALLSELLELAGVRVALATHGKEALTLLEHQPFDAVLVDMLKPVTKGAEVARYVRGQARLATLPIIACAARASERERAACLADGANDFISQPVDPARLWATLAHWLQPGAARGSRAGVADDFYQVTVPGAL
ncbi:response regulator [Ramlibacter sp. AN1015]|uniref:response regulator n=1 Tax=Ramlibacter sp. AN1015 TaxID=3133428 RepID=UPI0030BC8E2B